MDDDLPEGWWRDKAIRRIERTIVRAKKQGATGAVIQLEKILFQLRGEEA